MNREEDLAHLRVMDTGREIMQGDKLFPAKVDIGQDFVIQPPSNEGILGQIIAIVDGVYVAGTYQVVAINRGKKQGLKPGDALGVFLSRREKCAIASTARNWSEWTANYDKGAPARRDAAPPCSCSRSTTA
jgi:hypothetical protein